MFAAPRRAAVRLWRPRRHRVVYQHQRRLRTPATEKWAATPPRRVRWVSTITAASGDRIPIIFEDEALIVVDKPHGMLCVPGSFSSVNLRDTVADHVQCPPDVLRPEQMVVHRLDRHTSGLVIFAKTLPALRHLHGQLRDKTVTKQYEALVLGDILQGIGLDRGASGGGDVTSRHQWNVVNSAVVRTRRDRALHERPALMRIAVDSDYTTCPTGPGAPLPACTRWRCRNSNNTAPGGDSREAVVVVSRVELEPVTGRTHQLRLHMASLGHPIVGDPWYGVGGPIADDDGGGGEKQQRQQQANGDQQGHHGRVADADHRGDCSGLDRGGGGGGSAAAAGGGGDEPGGARLCLHAKHLTFLHPESDVPLALTSVVPF